MSLEIPHPPLKGKKALVVGVANDQSIAYGCAKAFHELGADLAVTYLNEKSRKFVEPLASGLKAPIFMPLDVATPGELEAVFEKIEKKWGKLDILCTRSRSLRKKTSGAVCSTARQRDSRSQWIFPVTRSCAWRSLPRRS